MRGTWRLRTATSIEHGRQAIDGRLVALGRVHDMLMQVSWTSTSLADAIRGAIEPYDSKGFERFSINGPDIGITSGAVIALAMTFNELCTNTTKFGALSVPEGRVEIACPLRACAAPFRPRLQERSVPTKLLMTWADPFRECATELALGSAEALQRATRGRSYLAATRDMAGPFLKAVMHAAPARSPSPKAALKSLGRSTTSSVSSSRGPKKMGRRSRRQHGAASELA